MVNFVHEPTLSLPQVMERVLNLAEMQVTRFSGVLCRVKGLQRYRLSSCSSRPRTHSIP